MTTLVFEMADINKLIEEIRTAKTFSVTADQIYDPACYPGGALLNAEGQTEEEARKAGRVFFPSSSKIASTHLVPKVLLAHSHGVYLITNAELEGLNRPGFPGECFICELRLPDHRFRWKHNKLFLLLPEEY
ncbi:hypothetical protein ACWJUB_23450, partial [Escherichia coli]